MVDVLSRAKYIRTCGRTNKTVLNANRRIFGDERTDFSQRMDAVVGCHGSGGWIGRTRYATSRRGSRTAARIGVPGQCRGRQRDSVHRIVSHAGGWPDHPTSARTAGIAPDRRLGDRRRDGGRDGGAGGPAHRCGRDAGGTLRSSGRPVDRRLGVDRHRPYRQGRQAGVPGDRRGNAPPLGQAGSRHRQSPPRRESDGRRRGAEIRDGRDGGRGQHQDVSALLGRGCDPGRQRRPRGGVREQIRPPSDPGQDGDRRDRGRRCVCRRRRRVPTLQVQPGPGVSHRRLGQGRQGQGRPGQEASRPGFGHSAWPASTG